MDKKCLDCKEVKPASDFHKHNTSRDKLHYYCKPCHKLRGERTRLKRKLEHHDKFRHIYVKYSLSREAFFNLALEQNNCCSICGIKFNLDFDYSRAADAPCVDHCHTTGKVRGLLCNHCNRGLGMFKDNADFLQKAIEYLKGK